VPYGPIAAHPHLQDRLPSIRANYAGLVTMIDTWFGRLMDTIDRLGLRDRTLVVYLSDHGTNFADNAEGILGKPADYLYPGTMDIPLLIRYPRAAGAGEVCEERVYSHDVAATLVDAAGVEPLGELEGCSLLPLIAGSPERFPSREYLTCRYGNSVWYVDDKNWFFSTVRREGPRLFDLEADPTCQHNIADRATDRIDRAWERIMLDAGGELPHYARQRATDALGRPVFIGG
jgi:arylsulfatase A-like enzyme